MFVYRFKRDVDTERAIDFKVIDSQLLKLLGRAEAALNRSRLSPEQKECIIDFLKVFGQTHASIRRLCKGGYEKDGVIGDVLSLAREQIEKLFALTLILHDGERWRPAYLKSGWKEDYLFFLHEREETMELDRFRDYCDRIAPQGYEHLRHMLDITDDEKLAVELDAAGKKLPENLRQSRIAEFPTPGRARNHFQGTPREAVMQRWYVEYKRYCAYSHAAIQKTLLRRMQQGAGGLSPSMRRNFLEKRLEPGLTISVLAIASAAAEVYDAVGFDGELLESLIEVWDTQSEFSLFGQACWELSIKGILPVTVPTA